MRRNVQARFWSTVFVALLPIGAFAQAVIERPEELWLVHDARQTQQKLLEIKISGYGDADVPPRAQRLLKQFKHQLRDVAIAMLSASDQQLQGRLNAWVAGADLSRVDRDAELPEQNEVDELKGTFGKLNGFVAESPPDRPDLLLVQTSISITCGDDSSLYIFKREASGWRALLFLETDDYDSIDKATGSFSYALPPEASGKFYVLTASVNPWCTSYWQRLTFRIYEPTADAARPKLAFEEKDTIYLGMDNPYKLTARSDGFQVSYWGSFDLAEGTLIRPHVRNYAFSGGGVNRVPPLAVQPEEFIDEWASLPPGEAARWSAEPLQASRSQLQIRALGSPKIDFVQPCGKAVNPTGKSWEVGLAGETSAKVATLFVRVLERGGAYVLQKVTRSRLPGCPGETPPTAENEEGALP